MGAILRRSIEREGYPDTRITKRKARSANRRMGTHRPACHVTLNRCLNEGAEMRRSERISWATFEGDDPEISLSDQDWETLEKAIGASIDNPARITLVQLCNSYLINRQAELSAAKVRDVQILATEARKRLEPVFYFMTTFQTSLPDGPKSDAQVEFESRMEAEIRKTITIAADPEYDTADGVFCAWKPSAFDGGDIRWNEYAETERRLRITPELVSEVASLLFGAIMNIEEGKPPADYPGEYRGFREGDAFDGFAVRLKQWAKQSRLPYGTSASNQIATPLSKLAREIDHCFPAEYRQGSNSAEAMMSRIRQAERRHRKVQQDLKRAK